jgi:ketosteroid isomerase-like protein
VKKREVSSPFCFIFPTDPDLMMKKYIFIFLLMASCANINRNKFVDELMDADKKFSALSEHKGMKQAFLSYMDSSGVLLRENHYPIIGNAAKAYIRQINDSAFKLVWQPRSADVAKSGDMGYTFGTYTIYTKDSILKGTYVSVWKKQNDGSWKFVLDAGTSGVGN